jgi:hypothetical protein
MLIGISFGQWQADVRLTEQSALSAGTYNNANKIAVSDSVVHVVWHDERDGNREIYYKRSIDNGATWPTSPGGDVRLTNATRTSEYPAVAVSGNNVHVVWEDSRNQVGSLAHYDIFYKHSTDGGITWSNDTQLTYQPMGTRSIDASIAVCGDTIHLVWEDYRDDLSGEIYYKRSVDGGVTWGSDVRLTTSSNFASWWPSIAVNGNNVHVVYRDSRDGATYNHEIYYKRSVDGGTNWQSDVRLTTTTAESWNPSVAVSGDTVHVAWNDGISYPNNSHEIYYKRSIDNGTTWSSNTQLTYATGNSLFASIAVEGSNVHIVWQDPRPGTSNDIYYIHSTNNGITWSSDTNLTNLSTTQKYLPGVAAAGNYVHVVWRDCRDYSNGELYYKRKILSMPGIEQERQAVLNSKVFRVSSVFNDKIMLYFRFPSDNPLKIRIYNLYGSAIFERNYSDTPSSLIIQDKEIARFSSGIYFLSVISDQKVLGQVKLIKR